LEQITEMISKNPSILGIVVAAVGALVLVGAILKWKWVIGKDHTGNVIRTGLIGFIIYKLFGRRVFFIFTGAVAFLGGIAWFVAMTFLMAE